MVEPGDLNVEVGDTRVRGSIYSPFATARLPAISLIGIGPVENDDTMPVRISDRPIDLPAGIDARGLAPSFLFPIFRSV